MSKNKAMLPMKAPGKGQFPVPLPAALVVVWLVAKFFQSSPDVLLCVCVSKFPLFIRTLVLLAWGPTVLQYDLIFPHYICNDPVSK